MEAVIKAESKDIVSSPEAWHSPSAIVYGFVVDFPEHEWFSLGHGDQQSADMVDNIFGSTMSNDYGT